MKIPIDSKTKGIIFDLDGTLIDSLPVHRYAWKHISNKFNFPFDEKMFMELTGIPSIQILEIIVKKHNLDLDILSVKEEKEKIVNQNLDKITLIEPVANLMYQYHNKIPLAIGTGGTKNIVQQIIALLGLDRYIDIIITAEDVDRHKPHPETFLKCADQMNVDPKNCLVLEDGEKGIEAGKAAGMITLDVKPYINFN